jgi:hypothetical protein
MGKIPVLKPREAVSILHALGFAMPWASRKFGKGDRTNSFDTPMAAAQRFQCIRDEMFSPILLRQTAKDIGLTVEELLKHR